MSFDNKKQKQPGVMLDYNQVASPGIKDSFELTDFLNYMLNKQRGLYFYLIADLSESRLDYGAGLNYRINY